MSLCVAGSWQEAAPHECKFDRTRSGSVAGVLVDKCGFGRRLVPRSAAVSEADSARRRFGDQTAELSARKEQ